MNIIPFRNLTGAGATWVIRNDVGPDNGQPIGGIASGIRSGENPQPSPGLGVAEASLGLQYNAFDGGSLLFVNNQQFVAPAQVDLTDNTFTAGSVNLSGLEVTQQFRADQTLPVLRNFVSFSNATSTDITVLVTLATNVGSDADTQIDGTSSGDLTFSTADRWLITDDNLTNGDLSNTHVLAGSGSPTSVPESISQTVFDYAPAAGTQGVLANYTITVPAQTTKNLLFFNGINLTSADARSAAAIYSDNKALQASTLLDGLTPQQLANTLNWQSLVPQISIGNATVTEGNAGTTFAKFEVSLSATSGKLVTVDYVTQAASATAFQDFDPIAGQLTFQPGETIKSVTVGIKGDTNVELNEEFSLSLGNAQNAAVEKSTGLGTILNDDRPAAPLPQEPTIAKPILGSDAADLLQGTTDSEQILGGKGNDQLLGDAGDDTLVGGAGRDVLTGGRGADRFSYTLTRGRTAVSTVTRGRKQPVALDHVTDLNPNEGDQIELLSPNAQVPIRPRSVYNAGVVQRGQTPLTEPVLRRAATQVYADKSLAKRPQPLQANEAVFFRVGSRTYLSVNDGQAGFSPNRDLVMDVTGIQFLPGDRQAGALSVKNYFASTRSPASS